MNRIYRTMSVALGLVAFVGVAASADEAMMGAGKDTPYNDVPYAKLKEMSEKNPSEFAGTAKKAMMAGTVLMPGMALGMKAKSVKLVGELIDSNCQTQGLKGHKHAMCARVCVLKGSPIVFLAADGSAAYPVQGTNAAAPSSATVFDNVGNQNLSVEGFVNAHDGISYLSIEKINGIAVVKPAPMMGGEKMDKM